MLPASPQHSSGYFSNMQDSQMNRKLPGIALLGTWKGFPSAKAACCVNGRNYKGIRRERTCAADRKGQSSTGKCSGVGLCGHLWKLPGLGTGRHGAYSAGGGRAKPPDYAQFSLCPQEPIPGQIRSAFAAPAPRTHQVSAVVTESSGEGKSHQLTTCSD